MVSGCQSYDAKTKRARDLYYSGAYADSEAEWESLKASQLNCCEKTFGWCWGVRGEADPLVDLEIGMVNFAAGKHEESSRALEAADQTIEVIDFTEDAKDLGKYLISESSDIYALLKRSRHREMDSDCLMWVVT